eukprot:662607_1
MESTETEPGRILEVANSGIKETSKGNFYVLRLAASPGCGKATVSFFQPQNESTEGHSRVLIKCYVVTAHAQASTHSDCDDEIVQTIQATHSSDRVKVIFGGLRGGQSYIFSVR